MRTITPPEQREGRVATAIESQTTKLPSDTWLWLAGASIIGSLVLKSLGRDKDALFVGQWPAPCFASRRLQQNRPAAGYRLAPRRYCRAFEPVKTFRRLFLYLVGTPFMEKTLDKRLDVLSQCRIRIRNPRQSGRAIHRPIQRSAPSVS